MMNITYTLIDGGYRLDADDGSIRVIQAFKPDVEGLVPFTPAEAETAALAQIAALTAEPNPLD